MLRFLRRYNKSILVVGGVLLLVAWAVSDSLGRISAAGAAAGTAWGVVEGRTVTAEDRQSAQTDMKVLQAIAPLMSAFGRSVLPIPDAERDPVHYYLLRLEAEQAGLVGPPSEGARFLSTMLEAFPAEGRPSLDLFILDLQRQSGQTRTGVLEALARVEGIWRLVSLYDTAPRLSERRMKSAASRLLATVDTDLVVLDARRLAPQLDWTPTEADLEAQLETYGDAQPGPESPFGYRLPNRVKVEWIVVSGPAIRASLENSDQLGNIELRKHRERNLSIFPRPLDGSDDFEFIRDSVRQHRLNELYETRVGEITKFVGDQLQLPLRGLPRDGLYLKLPEGWADRQARFDQLAHAVAEQFGVDLPIYQTSGPVLIEPQRVGTLPGLGTATSDRFGATPIAAPQLIAQARELGGSDTIPIQAGVAGPALRTPAGDIVFFRITEVDAARAPRDVEEVRARLVEDVRVMEQFRRLVEQRDALKERAARDGLLVIAAENNTSIQAANDLREIGAQFLPGVGQAPDAIKAIVDFALGIPRDGSIASVPDAERTFVQPVENRLLVLVGRVVGIDPLTIEDFESIAASGTIERAVRQDEAATLRDELFGRQAMMDRFGFRLAATDAEEEDELAAAEAELATE